MKSAAYVEHCLVHSHHHQQVGMPRRRWANCSNGRSGQRHWVHLPNGLVFTAPTGGWEYPLFLLAASLGHRLLGDGACATPRSNLLVPA